MSAVTFSFYDLLFFAFNSEMLRPLPNKQFVMSLSCPVVWWLLNLFCSVAVQVRLAPVRGKNKLSCANV